MQKIIVIPLLLFFSCKMFGQEVILPNDFRQHSLTQFNSSLLNATYALDWNKPRSLSLWTRWQWQTIDGDPSSLFVNYSHNIGSKTAVGLGFLQHNTGFFLNTGGVLNFAQAISLKENINLIVGANIYLFTQQIADDRFNPDLDASALEGRNDFIAQFSPSVRLNINQFNIAASLDNTFDYNFSQGEMNDNRKIFTGAISNDFSFELFPFMENSFLRPLVYVRTIPNFDTQFGGNLLLSTSKFWVQGGYNSFYGVSGGLGGTFFNNFSLGGLIEYGLDDAIDNEEPTFELVASYHFGKPKQRKLAAIEEENEEKAIEEAALLEAQRKMNEEAARVKRQDSLNAVRAEEERILKEQQRLDSIAKVAQEKEVVPLPNEKYEEVNRTTIDGLQPGFYLIANVFGTKKYFEAFMQSLRSEGLEPKSFYRSENKFNYVYIERYNTIEEARRARNSNFNGTYSGKTWIFRVRAD